MTTQSRRLRLGLSLVLLWLVLAVAVPPAVAVTCAYLEPAFGRERFPLQTDLLDPLCAGSRYAHVTATAGVS